MVATKKEQRPSSQRITGDAYMIKILTTINDQAWVHGRVKMKTEFTGKILDATKIANFLGMPDASNSSFQDNLEKCVTKDLLIEIRRKKDLTKVFSPGHSDREDYNPPSYVLTQKGLNCAKAISYCNSFHKMSDVLKAELDNSDEKNGEIIKFIDENLGEMDNIFRMLKNLPSIDLGDDEIIEDPEDD